MASESNKSIISPHAEGLARLAFSPDGRYLYTCGYEGYMRVFDASLDEDEQTEPIIVDYHQDAVVSLTATSDYLVSASESGQVVLHKAGTSDFEGFLTRFSLPARSVRFDPKGKRVVVTSDEVIAKVVDAKDPTRVQLLAGHSRSIREASWSPDGQLITTSSVDGSIRVWQLDAGTEPTCVQVIDGLIKAEDCDSEFSVEAVWHPGGKFFVVAGKDNDIAVVSRDSWQKTGAFSSKDGHSGPISYLAFSANGLYLASAGKEGDILVWSVKDRSIVARTRQTHGLITGLAFHPAPTANSLAYIDNKGQLTRWADPVPSHLPPPTFSRAAATSAAAASKAAPSAGAGAAGGRKRSDSASTSTSSHAGGKKGKALFRGGDSEDEYGDLDLDGDLDGLDGWIDDDLAEQAAGGPELDMGDVGARGVGEDDDPFAESAFGRPRERERARDREDSVFGAFGRGTRAEKGYTSTSLVPKGQAPFQPGATPWREKRRYLAFNMIGYIFAVEREEGQSVTVEFHDRSAHIPQKFDDPMKYTLAALGELGAVFSCPSVEDHPSQVFYKPYESWTSLQNWTASLPAGEDATVLAVGGMGPPAASLGMDDPTVGLTGSGTVLVGTSRGFVRFFSGAGLQKYVWNVGEEVVAMAAGKDWAMVVHRANGGAGAALEFALIDTDTFEVVQQGKVPLPGKTTLKWIGFTDDNIPVMYDSTGLLSILDRSRRPRQGRWLPTLDTTAMARAEGKQESYWPVGVTEQQAHVVILKGGETYPHFPTPLLQELSLQVPLLNLDVPQGQLEEKYIRESVFVSHRKDGAPADDYTLKSAIAREELATDKHLLQIIQTYCKADRLEAALDAVLLLSQPASLIAASKIAGFFDMPALQERVELLQQAKEDEANPDEAAAKRQSKWAHLADDRYITTTPVGLGRSHGGNANLFAPGGADAFSPRPSGSSLFGSARRPASVLPASGSESGKKRKSFAATQEPSPAPPSDGVEEDEIMYEGDEAQEEPASSPKRMRVDSDEPEVEEEEVAAPPPKKAVNPFAKRAPSAKASAPAANPFADKKAGKPRDVGRTESFFNRVEGKQPPKGKGKGRATPSKAAAGAKKSGAGEMRQVGIFGATVNPNADAEKKKGKGGKKGKAAAAAAAAEGDEASATKEDEGVSKSVQKKLDAFRMKAGSAAASGLGSEAARELPREGEEMEETQLAETQEEDSQPPAKRQRRPSELETLEEDEAETQLEETQVDETQVEETQPAKENSNSAKENERPPSSAPPPASAASKLAQFAFKKAEATSPAVTPAVAPAAAVEEQPAPAEE